MPLKLLAPIAAFSTALVVACGASSVQHGPVADAHVAEPARPPEPTPEPEAEPVAAAADVETPEEPSLPYELIEGEPMFTVLPQDAIAALDRPRFVPAEEAFDFMQAEETVLGVVGKDGTAKCYSTWQLDSHEIVNDELDGEPIAATW